MSIFEFLLLSFLIVCAISVCLSKNLLVAVIIQMAYSLVMTILWIVLQSPDLAITEAAVGTGITSLLFFITLRRIHALGEDPSLTDMDETERTLYGMIEEDAADDEILE